MQILLRTTSWLLVLALVPGSFASEAAAQSRGGMSRYVRCTIQP